MPSQEQESILDLSVLSSQLLAEPEVLRRAQLFVRFVAGLLTGSAVSLYTLADDTNSTYWVPKATFGEATIHEEAIHSEYGLLGHLLVDASPILRNRAAIRREDYPHVDIRKTLVSLCYLPLLQGVTLAGALEIMSFEEELSEDAILTLQPAAAVAAAAITAGRSPTAATPSTRKPRRNQKRSASRSTPRPK